MVWRPKVVVLAVLVAVLALFFFPLNFGSFQSTHGPTTILSSGVGVDLDIAVMGLVLPVIVVLVFRQTESDLSLDAPALPQALRLLFCSFRC